jgi:hypothetical protein
MTHQKKIYKILVGKTEEKNTSGTPEGNRRTQLRETSKN